MTKTKEDTGPLDILGHVGAFDWLVTTGQPSVNWSRPARRSARAGSIQAIAFLAKTMAPGAGATFTARYGSSAGTFIVVVVDTTVGRLSGLVRGVEGRYAGQWRESGAKRLHPEADRTSLITRVA